jgi:uncharacterized C2H2 Zn-finger protein
MFATYGLAQFSKFHGEWTESTIPLHCGCGAVFRRSRSLSRLSWHSSQAEDGDSIRYAAGSTHARNGSVLAVCPSCGARGSFEPSGYPLGY